MPAARSTRWSGSLPAPATCATPTGPAPCRATPTLAAPSTSPRSDRPAQRRPRRRGAWFVTRAADGTRGFSRDGGLTLAAGVLRTRDGAEVLGYPGGAARGALPVPLRLPATDRALGRAGDARLEPDGSVAYTRAAIDPRSGARAAERVVLGRVALARFPAGSAPQRLDATRFGAPAGVVPHLGTPGDGTFPPLTTRARDAGALDLDAGLARLNEAYLAFEAIAAAHKAGLGLAKTTLDLVK